MFRWREPFVQKTILKSLRHQRYRFVGNGNLGLNICLCLIGTDICKSLTGDEFHEKVYFRSYGVYAFVNDRLYSRTEDIYIALKYLYTCDELSDIYGDTFEITDDEIICYKSEGQSFFLLGIYKGEADYGFRFEDGIYRIKLNKGYFGRWTVISAGWQDPEEEEYNSGLYQY